jgi:hypothetical protein
VVRVLTAQDTIWDLQSDIPNILVSRKSEQSLLALKELANRFPAQKELPKLVDFVEQELRAKSWTPFPAKYILRITSSRKSRLVSSEAELLIVIQEYLSELQRDIRGQLSISDMFWNTFPLPWINKILGWPFKKEDQNKKKYTPKDENEFSDKVAWLIQKHFQDKGVVINREVVVRANPGSKGERTDIQIDAIADSEDMAVYQKVTVIVEVKGIWNDELFTAMRTQLADQYLREFHSKSGIYLVGYFNCKQWDETDSRRLQAARRNFDDTKARLLQEAHQIQNELNIHIEPVLLDVSLR